MNLIEMEKALIKRYRSKLYRPFVKAVNDYNLVSDGDVIGSIVLLSKEQNTKMGDSELKVAQSAAGFLSSQMEI